MRNRHARLIATVLGGLAIAGVGCLGGIATATAPPGDEPVVGGEAISLVPNDRTSLDPAIGYYNGSTDGPVFVAIYDQLVRVDAADNITPRLAESVTSDDNVTWTVTLRPDLTFSDGTAFDAEAVKYNWERMAQVPGRGQSAAQAIASIEVVDERTVVATLMAPNSEWPRLLMANLGFIGSPAAMEELGEEFANAPVAAGPFVLESWTRDSEMVLARNTSYWDAPRPYLDRVTIKPVLDASQRLASFEAGEADLLFLVAPSMELATLQSEHNYVDDPNSIGGTGLLMNVSRSPLDDVRVRQAVGYALDLDEINQVLTGGSLNMVDQVFPESSPYADPRFANRVNDPARAQELIDEYVAENGGPVKLVALLSSQWSLLGQVIQQQLHEIDGLEFEIVPVSATDLVERRSARDFDIILGALAGPDPGTAFYTNLYSGVSTNYGQFSNADIDAALDAARATTDPDERVAAYQSVADLVLEEVPSVMLFRLPIFWGYSDSMQGVDVFDFGVIDYGAIWRTD